jgi:hypothetical protein
MTAKHIGFYPKSFFLMAVVTVHQHQVSSPHDHHETFTSQSAYPEELLTSSALFPGYFSITDKEALK